MLATTLLANAIDNGTIRIVLFIMILIAVALILIGCAIALVTLYNQRKTNIVK